MRAQIAVALLVGLPFATAHAQCADGSPPPCRSAQGTAPRRASPPLDDRTWIVVPFDNLNGNQEVDWLRSGSVNLLYLGMSRWTDVRVIDDERVADYLREVPGASDAKTLSLNAGLAVAKRAGAGRLVMGDVIKLGNRTTVNAKIFDVRNGQRLRTVREETSMPDSLMPLFGKLSQKVLNIPPPAGGGVGVVGTNSIQAYQEYVEGMQAMNLFDMARADQHLRRALEIDSMFALAHAKLSVLTGWISPGNPKAREHAEAAARLSASLPRRERALIEANVAFSRQDYPRACAGFRTLVTADSTDTDAWYGLGDCLFHDNALEAVPGDSTRVRWRGDKNASVAAFRQALSNDASYHLAYQHVVDIFLMQFLSGRYCVGAQCTTYLAVVRASPDSLKPNGDSLLTVPLALPRDSALFRQHLDDYIGRSGRRAVLRRANTVAERWVAANPTEQRARQMYSNTLLAIGNVVAADTNLRRVTTRDTSGAGLNADMIRFEIAIKIGRAADASRMYDSIRANSVTVVTTPTGRITSGSIATVVAPVFGRIAQYDSLIAVGVRQSGGNVTRERVSKQLIRLLVGAPADSFGLSMSALHGELAASGGPIMATRVVGGLLGYDIRGSRAGWPTLDTTVTDLRAAPALAIVRGDTARLRRAAASLDSLSRVYLRALVPDSGATLVAAEAFLVLRDSLLALTLTRRWLDSIAPYTPMVVGQTGGTFVQPLFPHTILLRADLAAGLGMKSEAALYYDRLLAFWVSADAPLQPLVERVRKSRAALGLP